MSKMFNLNNMMREKNITQLNLSMEIGVSQETISAYLNGKAKPSVETLLKLASFFNTTTDYILDRTTIDIKVEDVKPVNLKDSEFNLIKKYRSLSPKNQELVAAYLSGMVDKK